MGGEKVLSKDLIQISQNDHRHYLHYKNNLPFLNPQSGFLVWSERDRDKDPLSQPASVSSSAGPLTTLVTHARTTVASDDTVRAAVGTTSTDLPEPLIGFHRRGQKDGVEKKATFKHQPSIQAPCSLEMSKGPAEAETGLFQKGDCFSRHSWNSSATGIRICLEKG